MKTALILLGLALLVGLAVLGVRSAGPGEELAAAGSEPAGVSATSDAPQRPSFEVRVIRPRMALPFGGLLPARLFGVQPLELDETSPGAKVGSVAPDHLSLLADGWDLLIEADEQGRIDVGTRLVVLLHLAEKDQTLRCRPDEPGEGFLHITSQADDDTLGGDFVVELATCENVESGKVINWPPRPLTVRGSFDRLPRNAG